jgi:hypothetical protein
MSRRIVIVALLSLFILESSTAFAPSRTSTNTAPQSRIRLSKQQHDLSIPRSQQESSYSHSRLYMQQPKKEDSKRLQGSDLFAFARDSTRLEGMDYRTIPDPSVQEGFLLPVLSSSLLITGNTIGAGILVLPELAGGPGMAVSTVVLVGAYLMNLISGLVMAQVAIQQHETSGSEVPSSFKEFAEATLPSVSTLVSGISVFINTLVLAFDTTKAGQVGSVVTGMDHVNVSYLFAALLVGVVSTQSLGKLSQVASVLVLAVFASFASVLLPGLANVSDPLAVRNVSCRLCICRGG